MGKSDKMTTKYSYWQNADHAEKRANLAETMDMSESEAIRFAINMCYKMFCFD